MSKKRPILINSYLSYGTSNKLIAQGRALEDRHILFGIEQSLFRTLGNIYKQFESNEIPNASLKLTLQNGQTHNTTTDMEGYYLLEQKTVALEELTNNEGWLSYIVSYEKASPKHSIQNNNAFSGQMLIPDERAKYGIISDIDDTILHTGVSSLFKWRLVANTLFKNFDKRIPLHGAAAFYKKLHYNENGHPINPFFYVSNSPWNLHDYLQRFLQKHDFPKGPVLLRDFWTPFDKTEKPTTPHKHQEITRILEVYPMLKFILIGDSGEKDPIYYKEIAIKYPGRILAIYLHAVKSQKKLEKTMKIIRNFKSVPMLLVNNSDEIAAHAKSIGVLI